eukprot:Sspe_Gene.35853::Locus_17358_Transcript_1_1_Confidence_1.000_Length_1488::g.35853::m.35853
MFLSIRGLQKNIETEESIAANAVNSSFELRTRCIIVLTNSGRTARLIAKYRPSCPIFAVTKTARTARQLSITRACHSFFWTDEDPTREKRVAHAIERLKKEEFLKPGD